MSGVVCQTVYIFGIYLSIYLILSLKQRMGTFATHFLLTTVLLQNPLLRIPISDQSYAVAFNVMSPL